MAAQAGSTFELDIAIDYLRNALSVGPRPTSEVIANAPLEVTPHALREARDRLGVRAHQRGRRWWLSIGQAGGPVLTDGTLDVPAEAAAAARAGALPMEGEQAMELARDDQAAEVVIDRAVVEGQ